MATDMHYSSCAHFMLTSTFSIITPEAIVVPYYYSDAQNPGTLSPWWLNFAQWPLKFWHSSSSVEKPVHPCPTQPYPSAIYSKDWGSMFLQNTVTFYLLIQYQTPAYSSVHSKHCENHKTCIIIFTRKDSPWILCATSWTSFQYSAHVFWWSSVTRQTQTQCIMLLSLLHFLAQYCPSNNFGTIQFILTHCLWLRTVPPRGRCMVYLLTK